MMDAQAFNIPLPVWKTHPYSGYVLKPNTRTNREQSKGKYDPRPCTASAFLSRLRTIFCGFLHRLAGDGSAFAFRN
jgi:hypothetical protein